MNIWNSLNKHVHLALNIICNVCSLNHEKCTVFFNTLNVNIINKAFLCISDGFHDSFPRISSRRSVRQKESFVRSFVQSCFRWMIQWVVQTHFLPPPLVLVRESRMRTSRSDSLPPPSLVLVRESRMPAESFRLTSALRPSFSFSFANASRVGQTHFLPRSQHSNESRFTIMQWCKWLSINTQH